MKKLLSLILLATLFIGCSSDDDDNAQNYTSFVVTYNANVDKLPNCVAAYKKDNKYYKLGDLGDLTKGKWSPEVRVNDNSITEIYIFSDYNGVIRFDAVYKLKSNTKNSIIIAESTGGVAVTDKTDPAQYPH